jgi:hypothetical protein
VAVPELQVQVAAAAVEKAHFERALLHCMVVFKFIVVTKCMVRD